MEHDSSLLAALNPRKGEAKRKQTTIGNGSRRMLRIRTDLGPLEYRKTTGEPYQHGTTTAGKKRRMVRSQNPSFAPEATSRKVKNSIGRRKRKNKARPQATPAVTKDRQVKYRQVLLVRRSLFQSSDVSPSEESPGPGIPCSFSAEIRAFLDSASFSLLRWR